MPDWLKILKDYTDSLETIVGTEGGVALANKLTAARALLLDQITALRMAELDAANLPADVDTLLARLTALRAGYLDNINNAQLLQITAARLGYIDLLADAINGLAAIKAEVEGLAGAAMRGTDGAALAASWTAALAAALGNYTAALATALGLDSAPTSVGKLQTKATTIDLAQIAGTYDLFTGTTQDVLMEKLVIRMSGGTLVGSNLTSFKIQTNDTTPQVFISDAEAPVADLTDQAQKSWAPAGGVILLKVGKKIQLTITGGAATAAKVADVVAGCSAVVAGGYLL